ncbi:unnamed protein product [Clonostachys rhizophaga]|uniref:Uncharacterized protein n=1 Tax=Clonostachys rhizophaga TaxID=160324 RepID=A0A9N9VLB7_9HYPO|nr:unnamed protein product [Clonostachys rhizophaga]
MVFSSPKDMISWWSGGAGLTGAATFDLTVSRSSVLLRLPIPEERNDHSLWTDALCEFKYQARGSSLLAALPRDAKHDPALHENPTAGYSRNLWRFRAGVTLVMR